MGGERGRYIASGVGIVFGRQDAGGWDLLLESLPQNATVWTNVYWDLNTRKKRCISRLFLSSRS